MTHRTVAAQEERLAALCGRRHCVMTGRGSSALYIAYRALGAAGGRVVLPAILCPSPAYAALYAGATPLFCDVSATDATLSPEALDEMLTREGGAAVVVAAHLYGNPADMAAIEAVVRRHGAALVEDAAQSLGGSLDGQPHGAFGDVSVLSFGYTKIVDIGHGGAALTDDDDLARRLRAEAERLPVIPRDFSELGADYRAAYYDLAALAAERPRLNLLFVTLPETFRDLYLFRFDAAKADALAHGLDGLEEAVAARRNKAAIYRAELANSGITLQQAGTGAVPWRFNVMLSPDHQREITETLRAAGFDASNWYLALYRWFDSGRAQDPNRFPNAQAIERSILNLWLDPATDETRIRASCEVLRHLAGTAGPQFARRKVSS